MTSMSNFCGPVQWNVKKCSVCKSKQKLKQVLALEKTEGRFTLRRRSSLEKNYRGILKFDWLRVTFLFSGGLHYGQESFGGELCTWMKKWHCYQCGDTFLKRSSLEVKFLGQPQTLGQENWPPENPNLNKIFLLFFPLLRHTIPSHVLGSIANSWPTSALLHHSVKRPWVTT